MTTGDSRIVSHADDDVWRRIAIGCHVVFGLLVALAVGLACTDPGATTRARILTMTLLAVLCLVYATLGGRLLHTKHPLKSLLYVVLAGALILAVSVLQPVTGILMFVLYAQVWWLLAVPWAIATTVVMVIAVILARAAFAVGPWGFAALSMTAGLAIPVVTGLLVSKLVQQSIARARLVNELAQSRTELAEVSRQAGVLAERERLSRDLHDTLAQGEHSVLLLVRAARSALSRDPALCAEQLTLAEQVTSENLNEVRALVGGLVPTGLDAVSLPAAVRRLAERPNADAGATARVEIIGAHRDLPASVEIPLFRVIQEALANVRKHSAARAVRIELHYEPDRVILRVVDDGRGFEPGTAEGFGLSGMRTRVAEIGGAVSVDTAPGTGVALTVCLPTGGC